MSKTKCIICTESSLCIDCKNIIESVFPSEIGSSVYIFDDISEISDKDDDPVESNNIVTFHESFDYLYIINKKNE